MKLLAKSEAESSLKRENDSLIETNIRLRNYEKAVIERLNKLKENYEPDKVKALQEYEAYCKDILIKKSRLLQELVAIQAQIDGKKETYYGIVAATDELEEKRYQINESMKKLELREAFVSDLEAKIKAYADLHQ